MDVKSIAEIVREAENNDIMGRTTSSKYVTQSMREDIDKTEAYLNSKHISGDVDYMGREKPFFNIVIAARNIWYRATRIQRKNITVRASKSADEIKAFLATILLQQWMKKVKFGKFLNDWGLTLASHGSAITKFIEKDGQLIPQVKDWNDMLVDAIDFKNNPKIEKLYFTPAKLREQKNYDQEQVNAIIENLTTRKTIAGQSKDNKSDYISVYEVHGLFPLSYLTDKEKDNDTFVQQMHVVSFQAQQNNPKGFNDYTLYKGREAKDPYRKDDLIEKDGQTYAGGAVKNLFEAQWMVNHNEKQIKDQLDLASKIIFQTGDASFVGQNVLTNIENGDILTFSGNSPLTAINNKPDIAAMQAAMNDWKAVANEINGISEALQGQAPASGTAWRTVAATLQENHSLFELMTENKGLAIIDMMTEHIIPFFKKQLNTTNEISTILEDYQIKQIDSRYVPNEIIRRVNDKKKKIILSGKIYDPATEATDAATAQADITANLSGNQRFIKPSEIDQRTWKDVLKDLEWDLDIDVTGESKDIQGILATLTTVLQTIAANPAVMQDPNMKMVFGKILSLSGAMSPIELQNTPAQPAPMAAPAPIPSAPPMATQPQPA